MLGDIDAGPCRGLRWERSSGHTGLEGGTPGLVVFLLGKTAWQEEEVEGEGALEPLDASPGKYKESPKDTVRRTGPQHRTHAFHPHGIPWR